MGYYAQELGQCSQCSGTLCTRGDRVSCGRCGLPHPDPEWLAHQRRPGVPAPTPPPPGAEAVGERSFRPRARKKG